jgi:hypothetical protein
MGDYKAYPRKAQLFFYAIRKKEEQMLKFYKTHCIYPESPLFFHTHEGGFL